MVALGSFSSRVGVSSPRRTNLGSGTGIGGGKKTIYGSRTDGNGTVGAGRVGNKVSTPIGNPTIGVTQGVEKANTSKEKRWGFYDALVGQRNQENDMASKSGITSKKSFTDKLGGVKYEVVNDDKRVGADGVQYKSTGYKKGKILIDKSVLGDDIKGRKNLAKAIGKLSKRGSLNKMTGKLSGSSGGFARDFSERNIGKVNRRSERSGKAFSKGTMKDLLK